MAFGLGFNKTKVLTTAEKLVAQGKIPAAIDEYLKLLNRDKKDLTILNTVADLCVRAGKTDEAVTRFCELAEDCVEAGLVPRAIATYKRVLKVAPESVQAMMRLGDLYSMQGLLRDSRTHYLQAVDYYSQNKEQAKARDVFEKVLMLDIENPHLQARMAGFYAETGKRDEAVATYLGAIERFLDRNMPADAAAALQNLLYLDPQNPEGRILLGRSQLEQGQINEAIQTLQAIPTFASHKVALNLLFQAATALGDDARSRDIAGQLFEVHDDFSGLARIATELAGRGQMDAALEIYQTASEKLLAEKSSGSLIEGLNGVLAFDPSHTDALELVLRAYQSAGSVGEVRETMERLAQAYRSKGDLEKARELYQELVTVEPENSDHLHLLRQVEAQMGRSEAAPPAPPQPAAAMYADMSESLPDLAASAAAKEAPPVETVPSRESALVQQCITEAELCITYKQFVRAIETLEDGLAQAPGNIRLLEQLLSLYEQTRQYGGAADCCESLAEAYAKLGDGERAALYNGMIANFRQKASSGESAPFETASRPPSPSTEFSPAAGAASAAFSDSGESLTGGAPPSEAEAAIQEVDLSMEWASVSSVEPGAPSAGDADSLVEEIEFYSQAGLTSDAIAALSRLEQCAPSHPSIAGFRERLGLAASTAEASPEPAAAGTAGPVESEAGETGVRPVIEFGSAAEVPAIESFHIGEENATGPASAGGLNESQPFSFGELSVPAAPEEAIEAALPVSDNGESAMGGEVQGQPEPILAGFGADEPMPIASEAPVPMESEFSLEGVLPAEQPLSSVPAFELSLEDSEIPPAPAATAAAPAKVEDFMASLTGELESAFPASATAVPEQHPSPSGAAPPVAPPAAKAPVAAPATAGANSLQDLFAEFKAEMEEPANASDLETHYNLGVAFKEMALYDEAIGEFQKAQQIAVSSNDYSHVIQCCSLLATCFLEKGLPQLAVKWYQTALDSPGVDPESKPALLYEMGSAQETAGDRQAALRSFLDVYAHNIDYRDVATRIKTLQQPE